MSKEEQYLAIRNRLAGVSDFAELPSLKENFRPEIDSDRRFDEIKDLMSLIRILEKRDVINIKDLRSLIYIARQLKIDIAVSPQTDQVMQHPNIPQDEAIVGNATVRCNSRVLPQISSDPIEKVYDLICIEIGQKWKDFARALRVREGFIDSLESQHRNRISEMAREIITFHKENCDPRYWKCELSDALITARRRDLSKKIERIFAMHS